MFKAAWPVSRRVSPCAEPPRVRSLSSRCPCPPSSSTPPPAAPTCRETERERERERERDRERSERERRERARERRERERERERERAREHTPYFYCPDLHTASLVIFTAASHAHYTLVRSEEHTS